MSNELPNKPLDVTSDEKLLAMLSHLSILFGGILIPVIIWATQKDRSKFVTFHSLQAIFYHIAIAVIIILFAIILVMILLISGIGFGMFDDSGRNTAMPIAMVVMLIIFYAGIFIFAFAGIGYGIYLAIKSYGGYLTKVPIIGKIIYKKVYEKS